MFTGKRGRRIALCDSTLNLDDTDTEGEEEEGYPFEWGELFPQENDGEGCGGEDLHLVGDLEGGSFQVRGGDELQIILDDCICENEKS